LKNFIIESDIDSPLFTTPFADIHHLSQFNDEEEVLFMIGAIFRIVAVELDVDINNLWTIKLVLCDEKSYYQKKQIVCRLEIF
jgi:hypothetical protein